MPSGAGDLNLATLWVPVAPSSEGIESKFREVGEKGRRSFSEGFGSGAQHGQEFGGQLGQGMIQGLEKADLPGAFGPIINQISGKQSLLIGGVAGAVTAGLNLVVGGVEAMAEAVEKGVETVVSSIEHIGDAWEHIQDQLAEFSTNPLLSGDAQKVLENLDAPATKLGEDLALLNSRLGLTGDSLDSVSRHVEILRDRLGDVDVDSLTQGMHQFDVEGDQVDNMLGLLVEVQQRFGTSVDTIVGQIARESEALQDLGLSYAQSVFMLGELDSKNKAAGDSVAAMISMSEKHAAAHHETIQKYITDELAAIQHYHDIGREDLANQEAMLAFGARRWKDAADFAKAYFDTLNQDPSVLAGHAAAIDRLAERTHHLSQAVEEFSNHLLAAFGPTAAAILELFTGGLDKISGWFDTHQDQIIGKIRDWGDAFIDMLPAFKTFAEYTLRWGWAFGTALKDIAAAALDWAGALEIGAGILTHSTALVTQGGALLKAGQELFGVNLGPIKDMADWLHNANIDTNGIKNGLNAAAGSAMKINQLPSPGAPGGAPAPPALPSVESPDVKSKAGAANKSPQQFLDDEKGMIQKYHDQGRDDLAEQEAQSAFGKHWQEIIGGPAVAGPPSGGQSPYGWGDPPPGGWPHAGGPTQPLPPPPPAGSGLGPVGGSPQLPVLPGGGVGPAGGPPVHTSGYVVDNAPQQVVLASSHTGMPHIPAPQDPGKQQKEIRDRQDRVDSAQDSMEDANDRVTDARGKEADKQQALTDATTAASDKGLIPGSEEYTKRQAELKKATEEHTAAEREVTRALHDQTKSSHALQDAQDEVSEPLKGSKDSKEGGPASDLGSQFLGGMMSDLGLGNVFGGKSPLQFGAAKMGLGALNWALGAFGHPGGAAAGGAAGEHVTGPAFTQQQGGEHAGPLAQQGAQPGIPATAEPNVHRGWGMGPAPAVAPGVTMAGYSRPVSYGMPGMPAAAGTQPVTTAGVSNQPSQPVTTAGFTSQSGTDWDKVAAGESGGNWQTNTGNSFYGGLQFTQSSWEAAGGKQFAARADLANPDQQKTVAEKLLSMQGPGAWPNTYHLGAPGAGGAPPVAAVNMPPPGALEANPGATDTATSGLPRYGGIPGAPSGMGQNIVGWMEGQVSQYNQATGSNLSITATYPGGPHGGHPDDGGDHSANRAVDIGGSPEQMSAFANYWDSRPDLVQSTRQLIHQGPGFADASNVFGGHLASGTSIYGPDTMRDHINHDHLAMQNIPGDINPMTQGQPHQGSGAAPGPPVSAAPNIAPQNNAASRSLGGIGDVLAALNQDWNPKHSMGILQAPPPRPGAVHYDNSVHISTGDVADPTALRNSMKEEMNSRFNTTTGGLPQASVGSP